MDETSDTKNSPEFLSMISSLKQSSNDSDTIYSDTANLDRFDLQVEQILSTPSDMEYDIQPNIDKMIIDKNISRGKYHNKYVQNTLKHRTSELPMACQIRKITDKSDYIDEQVPGAGINTLNALSNGSNTVMAIAKNNQHIWDILNFKLAFIIFCVYIGLNSDIFIENTLSIFFSDVYNYESDSIKTKGVVVSGIIMSVIYLLINSFDKLGII